MTAEEFKNHQGFDLVNFEDRQYPLSDILTHEIPKSLTFGTFKANISQIFNVPPERVRLWVFANRQNKTIRPDAAIPDSLSQTSNNIILFSIFENFCIKILIYFIAINRYGGS